ncbi:MAG TPA: SpoIIE family protein phosphatase [Candidatus Krumholzibacteria bacterium]|nr:SpoIIE family protein phosphatase [Candidatus Krumholzibacteria bacterium]
MSPERPAPVLAEARPAETARILIVDDEPGIQRAAQRILERRHRVTLASSGAQALEILETKPQDLAIVDVRMPGMTGFEVLKSIKSRHPDTEVIIMTGSVSNPDEKLVESLRERAFYFIRKPFEKPVLETLVERCLERQRLERENRAYTRTLEEDLERARAFQRLLLPGWFPRLPGLRGDVWYRPSERLGGDFYDFFTLGSTAIGVVLADVAGHGVMAALYTGMLKAEMRAVQEDWRDLRRLFRRVNERLLPLARNQFTTAVLAVLDLASREVRYVSAGHPSILDDEGRAWESTGPPLGILPGVDFEVRSFPLGSRRRLLFHTDGITEARSVGGAEFGDERLRRVFAASLTTPPDAALAALVHGVEEFSQGRALEDDATAILLEYSAETP